MKIYKLKKSVKISQNIQDEIELPSLPSNFKVGDEKSEELEIPPSYGYHITYVSRLNNILKRGIVLPKSMNPSWVRTYPENAIYLFTEPQHANFFANHIDLDRHKDWVILRVDNLDPRYIGPDHDFGDSWQESIRNSNSFSYSKSIPLQDIEVFDKAEGTDMERHDEFERLLG